MPAQPATIRRTDGARDEVKHLPSRVQCVLLRRYPNALRNHGDKQNSAFIIYLLDVMLRWPADGQRASHDVAMEALRAALRRWFSARPRAHASRRAIASPCNAYSDHVYDCGRCQDSRPGGTPGRAGTQPDAQHGDAKPLLRPRSSCSRNCLASARAQRL